MTEEPLTPLTKAMNETPLLRELREDPDLAQVTDLLAQIRIETVRPPESASRATHLAALAQAHPTPPRRAAGSRRRLRLVFAAASMKVALVSTAAVAATGGLAATDSLPTPAQDALARIVAPLGIELPSSASHGASTEAHEESPAAPVLDHAPGQQAEPHSPAAELAPGQLKREDEDSRSAREYAPGTFREPEPRIPAHARARVDAEHGSAPDHQGAPGDAGQPDGAGQPAGAGPPATPGKPSTPVGPLRSANANR